MSIKIDKVIIPKNPTTNYVLNKTSTSILNNNNLNYDNLVSNTDYSVSNDGDTSAQNNVATVCAIAAEGVSNKIKNTKALLEFGTINSILGNGFKILVDAITPDYHDIDSFKYSEVENDGYTAQGFTKADRYAIISAYKSGENEKLYVYDRETGEYITSIELDCSGHAGGTAYDEENNVLYVTEHSNRISVYDMNDITSYINGDSNSIKREGYIELPVSDANAATITCSDGSLYATTFVGNGNGVTFELDVSNLSSHNTEDDKICVNTKTAFASPRLVQGVTHVTSGGKDYLVYAQSIDFASPSHDWADSSLIIYEQNSDGSYSYVGKKYVGYDGMEGIYTNESDDIMAIFEYENKTVTYSFEDILNDVKNNGAGHAMESALYQERKRDVSGTYYDSTHDVYTWSSFVSDYTNNSANMNDNETILAGENEDNTSNA